MKGQKINLLSVHELIPNKNQPRNDFCQEDLENLSRSIKEHGVLQPLIVRKRADIPKCELNGEIIAQQKYEIIAGERRWRASRLAGVKRLPCIILGANDKTSAIIAITENMQREDLSFFEAAYAFKKLIEEYGITQSELAQKLSLSQSTVANKLRLLRFSEEEMKVIEKYGLSERHARELIRIKDEQKRKSILSCAALEQLSIKQTQQFADRALLSQQPEELLSECQTAAITADTPAEAIKVNRNQTMTGKKVFMLRDVRAFFVSLDKYMLFLKKAGVDCTKQRCETDEYVEIRIRIPKYAAKNF